MSKMQDQRVERYEKRLAEEVERQVEENKRNKTQQQSASNPGQDNQGMPDSTDKEQNKKRDRDLDTTASDQNDASSSSGIQRDSAGKPIDTKMQEDETHRNNKRTISDEGQTE